MCNEVDFIQTYTWRTHTSKLVLLPWLPVVAEHLTYNLYIFFLQGIAVKTAWYNNIW